MSGSQKLAEDLLLRAGVKEAIVRDLALYMVLLHDANQRVNLTGAKSLDKILPHVIDSLSVVPFIAAPYIDVGSGGGLPGIPVAIATGAEAVFLEPAGKKANFLRGIIQALGLEARVVQRRAEDAGHDAELRERFASATARAVAAASVTLELAASFVGIGCAVVMQRGRPEPGEESAMKVAAAMLGCAFEGAIPLDDQRRLLIARKAFPTPLRFPRRVGVPQKRPLGTSGKNV